MISEQYSEHPSEVTGSRSRTGIGIPGGTAGNARLTAVTGVVLVILLFLEGMTVLNVRGLLTIHVFLGLLIIPPLVLKLGSVGYRFLRYYSRNADYRESGPPHVIPRLIAPVLVLSTLGVFGSGVGLLLVSPNAGDTITTLHSASFFLWFCAMAVHFLAYIRRAFVLTGQEIRPGRVSRFVPARSLRMSLVAGSILLGVVVAVAFLPLDSAWLQWAQGFGDH